MIPLITSGLLAYGFWVLYERKRLKSHPEFENPEIQGINRRRTRTTLCSHNSLETASQFPYSPGVSRNVESLNGEWVFELCETVDSALELRKRSKALHTIHVPGCWQAQGYDIPLYTNINLPFDSTPPYPPSFNPTGLYQREVVFPPSSNQRTFLTIEAVSSCVYVWLDESFIGFSKDSRVPVEFEITHLLGGRGGREEVARTLSLVVPRFSDGSYLENQDMWNASGVIGSVYLLRTPRLVSISNFNWNVSDEGVEREVEVDVWSEWDSLQLVQETNQSSREEYRLQIDVYKRGIASGFRDHSMIVDDLAENSPAARCPNFGSLGDMSIPLTTSSIPLSPPIHPTPKPKNVRRALKACERTRATVSFSCGSVLPNPYRSYPYKVVAKFEVEEEGSDLWSPSHPFLYSMVLSLYCGNQLLQAESCWMGIRRMEVKDGTISLNNRYFTFRGVNMHQFFPTSLYGPHSPPSTKFIEDDLTIAKGMGFNSIRMAHYPHSQAFYSLASVIGFLVVDEANIETHGEDGGEGARLCGERRWEGAFLSRVVRMVELNRCHVCILGWSMGNESSLGRNHELARKWLKENDETRLVWYEPASFGSEFVFYEGEIIQRETKSRPNQHSTNENLVELSSHFIYFLDWFL